MSKPKEFWIVIDGAAKGCHGVRTEPYGYGGEEIHVIEYFAYRLLDARCEAELIRNIRLQDTVQTLTKQLQIAREAIEKLAEYEKAYPQDLNIARQALTKIDELEGEK